MAELEKVIKGLSICVPETQDDSKLECSDCPYGDVCNPNDIVGITLPLILDIRALLKEQEAVEPITEHKLFLCSVCKNTLFREQKFCHECGKRIEWEGR